MKPSCRAWHGWVPVRPVAACRADLWNGRWAHDDRSSYATSIAPADHWDLRDVVALIDVEHKTVGSTEGHAVADTSPLQAARVATATDRLAQARSAVLGRDFAALADVVERDSLMMHAVMITSSPSLMYWQPATIAIMQAVVQWRRQRAGRLHDDRCRPQRARDLHGRSRGRSGAALARHSRRAPGHHHPRGRPGALDP